MPEFYHNLVTEKSFKLLQELKNKFPFVLIGGWAVFLYTKALKSKDIDFIVDYDQLEKLKEKFDVFKNTRLKKYEAKTEEVDIDIYLPHFSNLGIPAEEIVKHCQTKDGFSVPWPEIMLILKTYTYQARKGSSKGAKDLIDILSLVKAVQIDWPRFKALCQQYNLNKISDDLKKAITKITVCGELDISNHQMAQLKKKVLDSL